MNVSQIFGTIGVGLRPKQAMPYVMAIFFMLFIFSSGIAHGPRDLALNPLLMYTLGQAFWWSVALNRANLLIEDAHTLRIPAMARAAIGLTAFSFVFVAILPSILLASLGKGSFAALLGVHVDLVLALLVAMQLPAAFAFFGGAGALLPVGLYLASMQGWIPGVRDPGFVWYAWPLALVLAGVGYWLWRGAGAVTADTQAGWKMPSRLIYRRQLAKADNWSEVNEQTSLDLSSIGIDFDKHAALGSGDKIDPIAAIQAWLGSPFTPVPMALQLRRYVLPPIFILLGAVGFLAIGMAKSMSIIVIMFGQNVYMGMRNLFVPPLQSAFCSNAKDLEMLGTLPHLGRDAQLKTNVLRAVFTPVLTACAVQSLIVLSFAWALSGWIVHQFASSAEHFSLLSIFVSQLGGYLIVLMSMLKALVGQARSVWAEMPFLLLVNFIALFATYPFAGASWSPIALGIMLPLLLVPLAWMSISAWRLFWRRPHPFLLNNA